MRTRILSVLLVLCIGIGLLPGCAWLEQPLITQPSQNTGDPTGSSAGDPSPSTGASDPSADASVPSTDASDPSAGPSVPPTDPSDPSEGPSVPPTDPADPSVPSTEDTKPVEAFALSSTSVSFDTAGQTATLYAGSIDPALISWGSENTAVATFANGVVTAVASGSTIVYAQYQGVRYTCHVSCNIIPPEDRVPVTTPPTNSDDIGSFFDDAIFVGDSVTLKLSYYAPTSGLLGNAQFLAVGSYGVGHAARNTMLVTFRGQQVGIEDALAMSGAKKVFLMFGMNDLNKFGIDGTIAYWGTLRDKILAKIPDMQIFIQSMTPVFTGGESGQLNNSSIDSYNAKLKAFAEANGCYFVDIAPYMKDSTGGLAAQYCSDKFVHLTDTGANVWIQVLRAFADSHMKRS